jgi:membrane peptidoglycan carboxypeptidase
MAAMRRPGPDVDPNPMVRYRGPQPPAIPTAKPVPARPEPWRRSRVQRIAHLKRRRRERFLAGPGGNRLKITIFSSIAALLLILLSSTVGYAYNFYEGEVPRLNGLANSQIPQTTRIYDRHGTLLYTLYANTDWGLGGRSTPISYNNLPQVLQNAQIAAEDPTFWTNPGVDPQGIARAFSQLFSSGTAQSGGSTMTQQLIKNLSKDAQDTFQRKASEAALAIALTQQYSKRKIMEMYFNDTPYGAQESGVEAAVEDYFGLKPQCNTQHQCTPAVQYLDRDLSKCTVTKPKIDENSCAVDPILALARAAMLAGIPQNPTHFDPSTSSDNLTNLLTNRLPYVLDQMVADGMQIDLGIGDKNDLRGPITKDIEAQVEAKAATIKIVGFHQNMLAPHFVQWVIDSLSYELGGGYTTADYNAGYTTLENSGLNIYTTLDLNLEQFVEKDIKHNLRDQVFQEFLGTYGPLNTMYNVNDSAAVVMDAKTGEVLAMDGSVDYNDTKANDPTSYKQVAGQVNAALSYLQPGSTMKPIIYATAFEEGWYPGIRLIDNKTYFPRGESQSLPAVSSTYVPSDYQNSYHAGLYENVRVALANSYNIPAIKALMYAGLDNVANTAKRVGITAIDRDLSVNWHNQALNTAYGPSFALGTAGIPLLQMTDAYQTFANDGMHVPYHNILGIWDNYGHTLATYDPTHPNASRVFSQQVNFMVTNMLSDNPARHYEFAGIDTLTMQDWNNQPVAAKTGTTDGFKDNWTLGYTSNVVVGVWSGNANADPMAQNVIGITGAGPIWHDIIEYASGRPLLGMHTDLNLPPGAFPLPSGVVQWPVNTVNGLQGSGTTDWMIDGEQPQQTGLPACTNNNGNGNNGNGNNGNGNNGNCNNGNGNNGNGNNGNGNGNSIGIYPPLDNGNDTPSGW